MRFFSPFHGDGPPRQPIRLDDRGFVLDRDIVLTRLAGRKLSATSDDRDRVISLLSVFTRSPVSDRALRAVDAAAEHWNRGDKALANLRLVFSGLPPLDRSRDLERMRLATRCLDAGISPRRLMKDLSLDTAALDLIKGNPNHVPAGNGRKGGEFTSASDGDVAFLPPSATAALFGDQAPSILDPHLSPTLIDSLAALAARFAVPTAVLGTLLIPTPNSGGVTEGILPGPDGIRFSHDGPAGLFSLVYRLADDSEVGVRAESRRGLLIDPKTATAIGRDLGEQLALDLPALHLALATALRAEHKDVPKAWAATDEDEPKLCPAPVPDTPHGASDQSNAYEHDFHFRVNPLAPIPDGYAIRVWDPVLHRYVYFDDCFRYAGDLVDGNMQRGDLADAKGPRKQ